MILEDFYFIGRNQAEMFGINFHSEWGKFGMIFFGNLNDNSFQIDVDLKDHDQEDLLPLKHGWNLISIDGIQVHNLLHVIKLPFVKLCSSCLPIVATSLAVI